MIRSFRSKSLRRFAEHGDPSKLSVRNHDRVRRILQLLDVARGLEEMDIPGYFLHALAGGQRGRYSVRVSGNWRLTFSSDGQDADAVDLEDCH